MTKKRASFIFSTAVFIALMSASYIEGLPLWTMGEHAALYIFMVVPEAAESYLGWLLFPFNLLFYGLKFSRNYAKIMELKSTKTDK